MKLPFPSLLTPTTKILLTPTTNLTLFFYFYFPFLSHKIPSFLYFLSHIPFASFFYFLIFSFVVAVLHLFLSSLMVAASSPWQWWRRLRFEFGFGLMGFLLKVWFWVLSWWVFHWRFGFGFGLILVWFFFVFGWFCDWNIMGCDGLCWWWLSGG